MSGGSTPARPPSDNRRSYVRWLQRAIGPMVLLVILYRIDLDSLRQIFGQAQPAPLITAYLLIIPAIALRAKRWQLLLREKGSGFGYAQLLSAYAYAIFVGTVTPGRVGEFVKATHLTRHGWSLGRSLANVIIDRLYDVGTLLGLAFCGLALLWLNLPGNAFLLIGALTLPCAGAILVRKVSNSNSLRFMLDRFLRRTPRRFREQASYWGTDFFAEMASVRPPLIILVLLITGGSWAVNYWATYLFGISLGLNIGYWEMMSISAICSLVALLPISVLGVGTRDAALVLLLARYNGTSSDAIALSTLFLSLTLWSSLVCAPSLATSAADLNWREAKNLTAEENTRKGEKDGH